MGRSVEEIRNDITNGGTSLGIEFGSTRIKAVLVDSTTAPVAQGSYEWENRLENGIWTYSLEDIWKGLRSCYQDLAADVKKQYGVGLTRIGSMGISAMMHGYMAFDEAGELLVPFRTWRNTITGEAAKMEHCPFIPGSVKQRRTSVKAGFLHHSGWIYSLEADRKEGFRRRRCLRNVPKRSGRWPV